MRPFILLEFNFGFLFKRQRNLNSERVPIIRQQLIKTAQLLVMDANTTQDYPMNTARTKETVGPPSQDLSQHDRQAHSAQRCL